VIPRLLKWGALAAVLAIAIACLREPTFAKRYVLSLLHGADDVRLSFFSPRAIVQGAESPGPPRVSPEEQQVDPAALQAAAEYAAKHGSHALIVSRRSHIVFEQYWRDTNAATLSNAREFNQTLAAVMVGIALDERKILSLDETASRFIVEWQDDERRQIRIHDLLRMSSGLQPAGGGSFPWSAAVRERIGTDIRAELLKRPLEVSPGSRWVRQNIDPQMIALIVERATGVPYAQYVSEKLWKRIGAGDAYLWLDRPDGAVHAGCCLLARQSDWMRLAEVLTHDGVYLGAEILRPGWIKQMVTPPQGKAPVEGNVNFGFQVWIGSPYLAEREQTQSMEPYAVDDVFLMDGGQNRLWLVPSLQLAILRTGPASRDDEQWDDARIPNLIIRGLRDFVPPATAPAVDPATLVPSH
jgi:CubicO group peptidase (beta-lactamase class C family)